MYEVGSTAIVVAKIKYYKLTIVGLRPKSHGEESYKNSMGDMEGMKDVAKDLSALHELLEGLCPSGR